MAERSVGKMLLALALDGHLQPWAALDSFARFWRPGSALSDRRP